nr:MAG TPA: hypothetical protein [Caudoviricetes sp.]
MTALFYSLPKMCFCLIISANMITFPIMQNEET